MACVDCPQVQFAFHDPNGVRIFTSKNVISASWVRTLNTVGKAVITVPATAPEFDFLTISKADFGMTIETATRPGVPFILDGQTYWFLEKLREVRDENENTYTLTFADALTLIDRRLVPYLSDPTRGGVSRTFLDGQCANEMARTIENVIGSNAYPPKYQLPRFTVAPVSFASPTLEKGIAFRRLKNVMDQVAGDSAYNGVELFYDIIATPSPSGIQFTFKVFKTQRGRDRRDVVLRTTDPYFRLIYFEINRDVYNEAVVSGAGRETDRLLGHAEAPEATASDYSRRQAFKFSVSRIQAVLDSEAASLISDASGLVEIKAQLLGQLANEFSLGDRLMIEHRDILIDCVVNSIRVDVEQQEYKRELTFKSLGSTL